MSVRMGRCGETACRRGPYEGASEGVLVVIGLQGDAISGGRRRSRVTAARLAAHTGW